MKIRIFSKYFQKSEKNSNSSHNIKKPIIVDKLFLINSVPALKIMKLSKKKEENNFKNL